MGKFRFNITMSLDGYVAGPDQSEAQPLGVGGEDLHQWVFPLKTFQEMYGQSSGETGTDDDVLREAHANVGAFIMGRNMFGPIRGEWTGDWKGWWGDNPPYHAPVYVLTHHAREPLKMEGGTTFYFVTDGIEAALRQAREAAGEKDVLLAGGANVAQQYLSAGLLEEMDLHVVPQILGGGARLFDNVDNNVQLEQTRVIESPRVTHLRYRVKK